MGVTAGYRPAHDLGYHHWRLRTVTNWPPRAGAPFSVATIVPPVSTNR
ncbi:hypothetical protein ACQEVR_17085 [Actinomadura nitritigenes]